MSSLFIGLMSGTSIDGVDGVLVDFEPGEGRALEVLAHAHQPFEGPLASELLALNSAGHDELHRASLAANALVRVYAVVVHELLTASRLTPDRVVAVGAHGQTVRHRPGEYDATGYTIQLNNPALLAELTGIDIVADFRSRDVAAGGQGAPLVPAFHRAVFWREGTASAVLNLGGIANLSAIDAQGLTTGFDCGPANALMDLWCQRHRGQSFDDGGAWAASGQVDETLLAAMLREPYFALPPPKSTGRDLFNASWLDAHLAAHPGPALATQDVQATLAELTARSCAEAVATHVAAACEVLVCGGGALNDHMMARLAHRLNRPARRSDSRGLPALQVEACAFAWLAKAHVERRAAGLPSVTGASASRILGALYPT